MEGDSGKGSSELTVEGSGGARLTAQPRAVTRGPRLPSGRAKEGKLVWQLRDFGNRPSLPPAPRTLDTDTGSLRAPPAQDLGPQQTAWGRAPGPLALTSRRGQRPGGGTLWKCPSPTGSLFCLLCFPPVAEGPSTPPRESESSFPAAPTLGEGQRGEAPQSWPCLGTGSGGLGVCFLRAGSAHSAFCVLFPRRSQSPSPLSPTNPSLPQTCPATFPMKLANWKKYLFHMARVGSPEQKVLGQESRSNRWVAGKLWVRFLPSSGLGFPPGMGKRVVASSTCRQDWGTRQSPAPSAALSTGYTHNRAPRIVNERKCTQGWLGGLLKTVRLERLPVERVVVGRVVAGPCVGPVGVKAQGTTERCSGSGNLGERVGGKQLLAVSTPPMLKKKPSSGLRSGERAPKDNERPRERSWDDKGER